MLDPGPMSAEPSSTQAWASTRRTPSTNIVAAGGRTRGSGATGSQRSAGISTVTSMLASDVAASSPA